MSETFLVAAKLRAADAGSAHAAPTSASGSQAEEKEPAPSPPPLHTLLTLARGRSFGGEQMMGTILKSFLTRADPTIKKLHTAMAAGDITTLRREAHRSRALVATSHLTACWPSAAVAQEPSTRNTPETSLESCFQSAITDFGFVCEAIRGIIALRSCEGVRDGRGAAAADATCSATGSPRRSRRPSA